MLEERAQWAVGAIACPARSIRSSIARLKRGALKRAPQVAMEGREPVAFKYSLHTTIMKKQDFDMFARDKRIDNQVVIDVVTPGTDARRVVTTNAQLRWFLWMVVHVGAGTVPGRNGGDVLLGTNPF